MNLLRRKQILSHIREILSYVGDDPDREGLLSTPNRVEKSWQHLFSGYNADISMMLTQFDAESYDGMVCLRDIEFFSMCEHHMLPFYGKAHIAYIPNLEEKGKIVGVSKLARVLEAYSRRLQNQERITKQVTSALMHYINPTPQGAACIIEAKHMCIACRGVQKQHSVMVTSSMEGCFKNQETKNEFLHLIGREL